MENRKHLLIFLFLLMAAGSRAQSIINFEQADSVTNAQYLTGLWPQLIQTGKRAIAAGYDSPALRQRLGYAQMLSGDYSKAIKEYNTVLKNDSYNSTAHYYAYLCHQYLNQDAGAAYHAAYLDNSQQNAEHIRPFGLINAGIESSAKFNDNVYRQTANYSRAYLSNRLGWRLQLTQSVAYFNQYFLNSYVQAPGSGLVSVANTTNQQIEYYAKLSYSLNANLQLLGAYHYLNSNYLNISYNNHIGFGGLRYSGTHFALQGDVNMGVMIGEHLNQYNATLMFYPMGNLNFYTVTRGSYLQEGGSTGRGIFSQSVGYKLSKNVWAETSGNFGNLNNYNDADGLYIYNAIDPSKLKVGQTFFYQLGSHAQLQLNYTYEQKDDNIHILTYNQHSITAGLSWKF